MNNDVDSPFLSKARGAVQRKDFEALEGLRDGPVQEIVEPLLADYSKATDWAARDAIVFLVQDLGDQRLASMMRHALDSPTLETRAIAVSFLSGDHRLFESFLVGGRVSEERVDVAIKQLRDRKR
jgi:hypothetical protein